MSKIRSKNKRINLSYSTFLGLKKSLEYMESHTSFLKNVLYFKSCDFP